MTQNAGDGVLLIAATGGHLAQLHELADRIPDIEGADRTWVTFDTAQSRSMLQGENVTYVPYTAPRDWPNVARNMAPAVRLLAGGRYAHAYSTGSAVALSFLPLARARGLAVTYIESAARSAGPSVTGRILRRIPGIRLATQYPVWADERWHYAGSVFDSYEPGVPVAQPHISRVLVTLGTIPYTFPRLVQRMLAILPPGVDVIWQTGVTPAERLGVPGVASMSGATFTEAVAAADVVVAHAGTGSALDVLRAGKCPVLVPRELAHGEHVDDHQVQIAAELSRRGLALHTSVAELTWDALREAAGRRVATLPAPPPLQFGGGAMQPRLPEPLTL
jgi:UDP-N-acetylglucosamine--N-acetylmuramyl-(pentapeptide) pyrophosphoryl-undecaprenol N-acetylglucosamine transferase